MAILKIGEQQLDLPRNIALLDTNVLVALIDKRDAGHDQTIFFFDEQTDYVWAVTLPVIVESCGMVQSRCGTEGVYDLISWLLTPGNVWILPGSHPNQSPDKALWAHSQWMRKYVVDYVDSHLMELADTITQQCELEPHLPIVTFDTKDFLRCAAQGRRYSLYDMRSLDFIDFQIS